MLTSLPISFLATSFLAAPPLVTAVQRWAVESQQRARRNAMIAATATGLVTPIPSSRNGSRVGVT